MMPKLQGKVAVITGGSSGLGLATAQRFVREGAFVYLTGRRQNDLDMAAALIGDGVAPVRGDVQNLGDLDRLYERIKQEKGKIDTLVANAGFIDPQPLAGATEENFDKTFGINVRGLLFTVQKALPLFREGGSIILISSIAAFKGIPRYTAYSATKASVRSFVRTWTAELKDRGIRVNAISPGAIDTPIKSSAKDLQARLKPLVRKTQPYTKKIAHRGVWVEPELLAEIEYRTKSAEGKVRHPFYKGLREDLET
jgi:NAD(P)-dependent dehydrogenase (short-subunit alcohol dehydrogenase family)